MVHGDPAGLKLPPRVAPVQAVVIPIWRNEDERQAVAGMVARVEQALAGSARVRADWREDHTPGFKFNEWELKGVPLRLEIGPRDVAAEQVVIVRRDTRAKQPVSLDALAATGASLRDEMQAALLQAATAMRDAHTVDVDTYAELAARMAANAGWSLAHWCSSAACEAQVKAETKATIRCIPRDLPPERGACIVCGRESAQRVIFARAY
jgi:prolyl-tRNA synthetase